MVDFELLRGDEGLGELGLHIPFLRCRALVSECLSSRGSLGGGRLANKEFILR